jgi:hypothetical protein
VDAVRCSEEAALVGRRERRAESRRGERREEREERGEGSREWGGSRKKDSSQSFVVASTSSR